MTKKEWQIYHGLTDEDMERISSILYIYSVGDKKATVIKIWDGSVSRWGIK